MSADTNAGDWPDAELCDRINAAMDEAGQAFLVEMPSGGYGEWRRVRAIAAVRLIATDLTAREAAAAAMAMREMAVDDRAKLAKLIEDFYAPWGAWKTVWWEGEVGDCKPFGPDNLLHEIAARLSRALPLPAAAQAALDAVVQAEVAKAIARPDVAALLRGEAVAVPREAIERTFPAIEGAAMHAAMDGNRTQAQRWRKMLRDLRAMLAASPWAKEARDEVERAAGGGA